ncbi:MAG TPA: hypothetical protein VEW28_06595 [Candidatus Kapabacteria bacterium]|nr:hypothetical protein [Candidatus Kapabacteria bacterium]
MIFSKYFYISIIAVIAVLLTGCLTAEHKEFRVSLNPDGKSGTATLLFSGIHSEQGNDTSDVTKDDFNSLISEYYQGKKIENSYNGARQFKKRLFLDKDILMGEVTFSFDDISELGFYRYKNTGPYMYYTLADGLFSSGQFEASNGTYAGEKMPFVFWDEGSRDFYVKVSLSSAQAPEKTLVPQYKAWAKK